MKMTGKFERENYVSKCHFYAEKLHKFPIRVGFSRKDKKDVFCKRTPDVATDGWNKIFYVIAMKLGLDLGRPKVRNNPRKSILSRFNWPF